MPGFSLNILPKSRGEIEHPEIVRPLIPPLGGGRFAYLKEEEKIKAAQRQRLLALKGKHAGRRAFIMGNAPSIQTLDLTKLKDEVAIAVNSTFRLYGELGWVAPYTCFSDRIRWVETGKEALAASPGSQFLYCDDWEVPCPYTLLTEEELERVLLVDRSYLLPSSVQRWMFVANRAGRNTNKYFHRKRFSFDLARDGVCVGNSVIFMAAQLAVYMGCNPVVLLGVDMDYSGPVKHFHGGKVWTPPMDYDRDAKPWFILFRDEMQRAGVEFLNGSPGGKVDCLRRVAYPSLFG